MGPRPLRSWTVTVHSPLVEILSFRVFVGRFGGPPCSALLIQTVSPVLPQLFGLCRGWEPGMFGMEI